MSVKTVTITGSGVILTGPAHVVRITAVGPDGAIVNFYDSSTGKAFTMPALTLKNMGPFTDDQTVADCAGIDRDYHQVGVGYAADTSTIPGATTLPVSGSAPNGACALDVDMVVARGLFAEALLGGSASSSTVTVEYYPNISKP